MQIIKLLLVALAMSGFVATAGAQDAKPYKEGAVTQLSYIKTKPGKFNDYMKFLAGDYKKLMEANIKAGLVVRYGIYTTQPRNPNEANLILTVTVPNYATLDKVDERDAISAKIGGSSEAHAKAAAERATLRDILGGELIQEVVLK